MAANMAQVIGEEAMDDAVQLEEIHGEYRDFLDDAVSLCSGHV